MTPVSKYTTGVRFGIITGLIYIVLLILRFNFFSTTPLSFGIFALINYLIILVLFLFTGIARKKELGGYGEFREIFQSIFIAILITEAVYILFNFIYIKFVDPGFWENFKARSLAFYQTKGMTDEQIDQYMKGFKDADKHMQPMGLIKDYGISVIIDCVFGVIFASILRKKKPVFEEIPAEPK